MSRLERYLRCHFTRLRMGALVRGDVSPRQRAALLAHLGECEGCRDSYRRQAALSREFARELDGLGRARRPQLDAIWLNVQEQMAEPMRPSRASRRGAAAAFALLLTGALVTGGTQAMPALQLANDAPEPIITLVTATPGPATLALLTEQTLTPTLPVLQNTPNTPSE